MLYPCSEGFARTLQEDGTEREAGVTQRPVVRGVRREG